MSMQLKLQHLEVLFLSRIFHASFRLTDFWEVEQTHMN